jgi:acyl-coenzyme A thioesterase PaaI-like protein
VADIPEGFEKLFRFSEYTDLIGPLYSCKTGDELVLGMRFEKKHGNSRGKAHGGMISTLADIAMGYNMAFSETPPRPFLTVSLSIDFMGHIEIGDWVSVHVTVDKKGSSIAFARCEFIVDDRTVARASGVFKTTKADFEFQIQGEKT